MKIKDAIKHCEEVAEKKFKEIDFCMEKAENCQACAREHIQLAHWLMQNLSVRNIIKDWENGNLSEHDAFLLITFYFNDDEIMYGGDGD